MSRPTHPPVPGPGVPDPPDPPVVGTPVGDEEPRFVERRRHHSCGICEWEALYPLPVAVVFHSCRPTKRRRRHILQYGWEPQEEEHDKRSEWAVDQFGEANPINPSKRDPDRKAPE